MKCAHCWRPNLGPFDYPPACRLCHEKRQARMPLSGSSRSYSQIKIERQEQEQKDRRDAQELAEERNEDA